MNTGEVFCTGCSEHQCDAEEQSAYCLVWHPGMEVNWHFVGHESLREVHYPNHTCRGEGTLGKNVNLECSFVIGSEMRLKQR